jgi:hypothetical protein
VSVSLDAVIGRVDQILAMHQSLAGSTSPAAPSGTSSFAAALASAQGGQATSPTAVAGYTTPSGALSPAALATLPAGFTGAAGAGASGIVANVLGLAQALVGTPYDQGGHATAIDSTTAQVKQGGTDCSGYVSDLMGPNGLGIWSAANSTPDIPTAPGILPGKGATITLWNNPNPGNAGHVWIEFDIGGSTRYFEAAGGGLGTHEMSASEAQSYITSGAYVPLHPAGY